MSKKELLVKIYMSESSHKTLSSWENGKSLPDLNSLARMADLFGCDIGYASQITGLSPGAIEQLIKGDDRIVGFISFLIESNRIVPVGFNALRCVDSLLEIKHYRNEVLPKLPQCNISKIINTSKVSNDDIEEEAKRTAVIDEIDRLRDLYGSLLWKCEKGMSSAIETFIDEEVKKYG